MNTRADLYYRLATLQHYAKLARVDSITIYKNSIFIDIGLSIGKSLYEYDSIDEAAEFLSKMVKQNEPERFVE